MNLSCSVDKRDVLFVVAVVLCAAALRLYYFSGLGMNDDIAYAGAAYRIGTGRGLEHYPLHSIIGLRFMMVLPIALFYFLFDVGDLQSALYPLCCSLGTIVVTYAFARYLFGRSAAIFSAIIVALLPLDIVFCTQLVPNVPMAFFLTTAFYCFVVADRGIAGRGRNTLKPRLFVLFALSGLLCGLAWMTAELAVVYGLVFLSYVLVQRRFSVYYFVTLAAALLVLLGELVFLKITTGDFLTRYRQGEELLAIIHTNTSYEYYPRLFFKLSEINFEIGEGLFGLFWYFFVASVVYAVVYRRRDIWFLIVSVVAVLLFLEFGVMTYHGRTIAKWIRYILMITPIAAIVIGYVLQEVQRSAASSWFSLVPAAVLLLPMGYYIHHSVRVSQDATQPLKQIAAVLGEQPGGKVIYIDEWGWRFVDFYLGRERDVRFFNGKHYQALDNVLFVVDEQKFLRDMNGGPKPVLAKSSIIPVGWRLLSRIKTVQERGGEPLVRLVFDIPRGERNFLSERSVITEEGRSRIYRDNDADARCWRGAPEFLKDVVEIERAAVHASDAVLNLEMSVSLDPRTITFKRYTSYWWLLDLDRSVRTGYREGALGVEVMLRIGRGTDRFELTVDDLDLTDHYRFEQHSITYALEGERIVVRIPLKDISWRKEPRWRAGVVTRDLLRDDGFSCRDRISAGVRDFS